MARKATYTPDDIAQAALELLAAGGQQAVTARRVAETLGCSTAPVYSNFSNMEALLAAVRHKIVALILKYCRKSWSQELFLNMGIGFIHFAREYPQLFRAVYLEPGTMEGDSRDVLDELRQDLARHPFLGALPDRQMEELLFQAGIYTLGIATTFVTGRWEFPDMSVVEGWLHSVGGLLAREALTSAGLPIPCELEQNLGRFVVPWRHRLGSGDGGEAS